MEREDTKPVATGARAKPDSFPPVDSGAPDPRSNTLSNLKSQISNSTATAATHWAFQPPKEPPVPKVRQKSWPQTAIDHFILAVLEEKGLQPSPSADRHTLIRRATYDLL